MSTQAASASRYRELPPPAALRSVVACLWENQASANLLQRIVPDGCVDLIWASDGELQIAGPDTSFRVARLPAGVSLRGIRLRAGAAGAFLGWPASEVVDLQVPADGLWSAAARRLSDELAMASADRQRRLLIDAVARRAPAPDPLASAAAWALAAPGARVADVAAELGVGERRLHRRMLAAVGYGPKMLARVARLRRLIALPEEDSLAARAFDAGYASQAHMNDEVRRLTGVTPVRFLEDATLTAA
jgi:AraC-like DNA-binding protein